MQVQLYCHLLLVLPFAASAYGEVPATALLTELTAKRDKLPGVHQEFDVSRTQRTASHSQNSKSQLVVDISQRLWREKSITGSGSRIHIFNGTDLLTMEEDGDEVVRSKNVAKNEDPLPSPYNAGGPDWAKARELERRPCGFGGTDHQCVLLDVPLKPSTRMAGSAKMVKTLPGSGRVLFDTGTGLIVSLRTDQMLQTSRTAYEVDTSYVLKRMNYGTVLDASLFNLPSKDMREVKELSRWDAPKIRKQLAGKPAPELEAMDLQGHPVELAAFRGKTVLLDFWTTWCPPCRKDAPALDKLYSRYGGRDLMIVSFSVSEDRAIVEKFLKEHPRAFPVVLTSENDMPRAYQISAFPTYIVIDKDGTVASAVQGGQGFGDLRKLLKKAGLELD
jgi:thiol-disulfide isomerase/thioredoxin